MHKVILLFVRKKGHLGLLHIKLPLSCMELHLALSYAKLFGGPNNLWPKEYLQEKFLYTSVDSGKPKQRRVYIA